MLKIPNGFIVNLHSALTHTLTLPDMPPGVYSQSPNPEQILESVQYYIKPSLRLIPFNLILPKWAGNRGLKKTIKQHLTAQCLSSIWLRYFVCMYWYLGYVCNFYIYVVLSLSCSCLLMFFIMSCFMFCEDPRKSSCCFRMEILIKYQWPNTWKMSQSWVLSVSLVPLYVGFDMLIEEVLSFLGSGKHVLCSGRLRWVLQGGWSRISDITW